MTTLAEIPTPVLRDELLRRNALRPDADARLALTLTTRAAKSYGIAPAEVLSKRRYPGHCRARWAVITTLNHAGWLPSRIARLFKIDIGTVAHGIDQASRLVACDELFLGTLLVLRAELANATRAASAPTPTPNQ
jgi:hypothetical protein